MAIYRLGKTFVHFAAKMSLQDNKDIQLKANWLELYDNPQSTIDAKNLEYK